MLRGSKIWVSTPGKAFGMAKLNIGNSPISAFSIEPSKIASIILRVSLIEIRLPVPFQPVFTK